MLDNEVKAILQEQFSKNRNYQKVLNNINKKQIQYNKILKIALLPTCAAILAAIIIPNMNNNDKDYMGIAQVNTIVEEQETNTIVEIADGNEIVETPTIEETPTMQVETGKSNENKDNKSNEAPADNNSQVQVGKNRKYYNVQEGSEASWAVNPTDLEKVIKLHEKNKISIVRVKVTEVQDAIFLPKMKNYYDKWHPKTPVKVELQYYKR